MINPSTRRTFVDIYDINGTCRLDDSAKGLSTTAAIHKFLSVQNGTYDEGQFHPSYRNWVQPPLSKLLPPVTRRRVSDRVLSMYPVHMQIRARAPDSTTKLRALADAVAKQATFLSNKFSKGPIFPGAIAAIKALQAFTKTDPSMQARHTLYTFGGDGMDTWRSIQEATGLHLDGEGSFEGHTLKMNDGQVFSTAADILAFLQTGNFVIQADFEHWERTAGRGKLLPVSADSNVIVHFKDDNVYEDVVAPILVSDEGEHSMSVAEAVAQGSVVNVEPLTFAKDDGAFLRAVNETWQQHGWPGHLTMPET